MSDKKLGFSPMESFDVSGKRVLLRVDINSPIDSDTNKIVNENRIDKSVPTIKWLLDQGAMVGIIAHQGDTLDYQNLIPLIEHAEKLSAKLGREIRYIDDVCGPAAVHEVKNLKKGEAVLLGNLRYLTEEISTFEDAVKLKPEGMLNTWLVRTLAPHFDMYINDAFAAAHRNAPSMVAFQELLPSAAGPLFFKEVTALANVMKNPGRPSVFLLGGAKISDAFGMMENVLSNGTADRILTAGITGQVFLIARGINLGSKTDKFLSERSLDLFIASARKYLTDYPGKILMPVDLAFEGNDIRHEVSVEKMPLEEFFMDIGEMTINAYKLEIEKAGTLFVNGSAGVFEKEMFEEGTRELWKSVAEASGYSVIGGGDSVSAAARFTQMENFNYICTAGGAMVQYLSGKKLPLIQAMERAGKRDKL
ncbi:MAG: phosphoglycerate kinase [Spirochaetia bacterium]|jgi:phosphoglycerate kinase|nr:phosphoglycerate kinase [Spirochaetia bacterium]